MSKHTPGPWGLDGVEIRATAAHPSERLCDMAPGFEKADARLIAEAPELLRLLEAVLGQYESDEGFIEGERGNGRSVEQLYAAGEMSEEAVAARALLARLKGEEQ